MHLDSYLPAAAVFGLLTVSSSCLGERLPAHEARLAVNVHAEAPAPPPGRGSHSRCDGFRPQAELVWADGTAIELVASGPATTGPGPSQGTVRFALRSRVDPSLTSSSRAVAWLAIPTGSHGDRTVGLGEADLLYWHYATDGSVPAPTTWIDDDELSGSVSVHAVAYGSGETTCGRFELQLGSPHAATLRGTFRHLIQPRDPDDEFDRS
ncbi:MAG: hypothetical protein B7733_21785 [Myxococcales bacterium FL481]|nr:MAG: hypothetical protein B7733_21785 [Myxococcales bacterium FL481]